VVAGDPSFMNNVPDPILSAAELPTFKFALEKSEGKVIGNSFGKEATVKQLPIAKGIAGVSMRLEPGAMRELHWHATAAEWAFVIEGRVRTPRKRYFARGAIPPEQAAAPLQGSKMPPQTHK
jgi:oxalate decarboxylase